MALPSLRSSITSLIEISTVHLDMIEFLFTSTSTAKPSPCAGVVWAGTSRTSVHGARSPSINGQERATGQAHVLEGDLDGGRDVHTSTGCRSEDPLENHLVDGGEDSRKPGTEHVLADWGGVVVEDADQGDASVLLVEHGVTGEGVDGHSVGRARKEPVGEHTSVLHARHRACVGVHHDSVGGREGADLLSGHEVVHAGAAPGPSRRTPSAPPSCTPFPRPQCYHSSRGA
eukprot:3776598-Rhodomonas_salina.1